MNSSISVTAFGGAISIIIAALLHQSYNYEMGSEVQSAVQTVFVTMLLAVWKVVSWWMAKNKIDLDHPEGEQK